MRAFLLAIVKYDRGMDIAKNGGKAWCPVGHGVKTSFEFSYIRIRRKEKPS